MALEKAYNSVLNFISKHKEILSALISLLLLSTTASGCIEDQHSDSDKDGITNYLERTQYHTDPNDPDSDDDGLLDGHEIKYYDSDPLKSDTSEDGIDDGLAIELGLDPREKYPVFAYALKKLPKEIVKNNLDPLKYSQLTSNIKNMIDALAQYPKELENIVNKDWFKNMIADASITNRELLRMYDFDGDGIKNIDDVDIFNSDRDGDKLLDGNSFTLIGGKDPDLCKELMDKKIFYKEDTDGSITFFGEEDIGTDPDKYDTDTDNKGDGFEKFISHTDPLIKNLTYALVIFACEETSKESPKLFKSALERYGISSENIICLSYKDATFENYKGNLKELSEKMTENDQLLTFIDGHGSPFHFRFNDRLIKSIEIINELIKNDIKAKNIFVSFNSCYSGTLINELNKMKIDLPLVVYVSTPDDSERGSSINYFIRNSGIGYNHTNVEAFSFLDTKYYDEIKQQNIRETDQIEDILKIFNDTDVDNNLYVSLKEAFNAYCEKMKNLENNPKYNINNLSYDKNDSGRYLYFGDIYNSLLIKE